MLDQARQAGAVASVELRLGPRAAEFASTGQRPIFPARIVTELARDLGRSLDCYVPPTEAEAAVVSMVSALLALGWRVSRPAVALRG
jgi:hypothetical protein